MKQITPYLFFEGDCKEAMTFYSECLKGELQMMTIGESPLAANSSPEAQDRILHAAIMMDNQLVLMASDTMIPGQTARMGEGVYNTVICSSRDELERLFKDLAAGGSVDMPIDEAFFGVIASLTDKYGVKWMLEFDEPKK